MKYWWREREIRKNHWTQIIIIIFNFSVSHFDELRKNESRTNYDLKIESILTWCALMVGMSLRYAFRYSLKGRFNLWVLIMLFFSPFFIFLHKNSFPTEFDTIFFFSCKIDNVKCLIQKHINFISMRTKTSQFFSWVNRM